ncbi:hypothetical protein THOM_1957 [Trachipleistophora hominis]|uniref:Uncharacterized protein n=1 Tax=Trachipleistophora hominis TaxID=72359 RepID=L7JUG6_TRAHO|nr:hypothetical protein THOM_1957 [Trachipleistophora hominis]
MIFFVFFSHTYSILLRELEIGAQKNILEFLEETQESLNKLKNECWLYKEHINTFFSDSGSYPSHQELGDESTLKLYKVKYCELNEEKLGYYERIISHLETLIFEMKKILECEVIPDHSNSATKYISHLQNLLSGTVELLTEEKICVEGFNSLLLTNEIGTTNIINKKLTGFLPLIREERDRVRQLKALEKGFTENALTLCSLLIKCVSK